MPDSDQFQTLAKTSLGLYKEKGSKFCSYAAPIEEVDQAIQIIDQQRKEHAKARHHCYAYRLGTEGLIYRINDDGEPSGTGGRPILGQIDSFGLTDLVIVVSRYFGGKLLGASGLANAYKLSAADALSSAEIVVKDLKIFFKAEFNYEIMGMLMQSVARFQGVLEDQQFREDPYLIFSLPFSFGESQLDSIIAQALGMYPEEVLGQRAFPKLRITKLPWPSRGLSTQS